MNIKRENLVNNLKVLNLIETLKLVKQIEKVFGVSAILLQTNANLTNEPLVAQELKEEKNTFDITLVEVPSDKRISILKIVRNITGLGLKESKEIVDNVPKLIKEGLTKNESDAVANELESAGAKVIIK